MALNNQVNKIRNMTSGKKKNHHEHNPGSLNSKRWGLIKKKIEKLFEIKNMQVHIEPIPDSCGYQAVLKQDYDPRCNKKALCIFRVLNMVNKNGSYFSIYSHKGGWLDTKDTKISSFVFAIRQLERIKV